MPRGKPKWVALDPDFFQNPRRVNKAVPIRNPKDYTPSTLDIDHDVDTKVPPSAPPPPVVHSNGVHRSQHEITIVHSSKSVTHPEISQRAPVTASHDQVRTTPRRPSAGHSNDVEAESVQANLGQSEESSGSPPKVKGTNTGISGHNPAAPSSRIPPTSSNLDIYAPKYVPYWLKAINESHAIIDFAPQIHRIDFDAYHTTFAGADFQRQLPPVDLPPTQPTKLETMVLTANDYLQYWQPRLQNEYAAQAAQSDTFALFGIDLVPEDPNLHLYRLKVPGLRESAPRIDLGDIVLVRSFVPPLLDTIHQEALQWSRDRSRLAPGFVGIEHHAVVWSLSRKDEHVWVRLGRQPGRNVKCNVVMPLQTQKNGPAWRAVAHVAGAVDRRALGTNPWLSSMLFPSRGVQQTRLPKGIFNLNWYDESLNLEQMRAVQAVVDAKYGEIPYLISGPPGTGKTKTMVELALQLTDRKSAVNPHLLVCAPSDAAADILLIRLSAQLSPRELFRLNSWTRLVSEVPGEVRPYCYLDGNQLFSLPEFERIMSFKIVVTTCRDANMLITARLTNESLGSIGLRFVRAVAPAAIDAAKLMHWTALLVDEAAQATEPEVLIPISVVAPPHDAGASPGILPQVVMAGDEHQLGPRLVSTALSERLGPFATSGLEASLFQRLFARPLYADHPLSRSHGLRPFTRDLLPMTRPPFTNLIRNYRSHAAILSTCSALFYSDTLIAERSETSSAILSWPHWPKRIDNVWPITFHQNAGLDSVESVLEGDGTGFGSLINHSEAEIVLNLVTSLINHVNRSGHDDFLRGDDIIVFSPFRAQVNYLRQLFRSHNLHDIRIGPLEAFQGLEARVVVFCTTRTRLGEHPHPLAKFVNEDKARNLGVIDVPRQFNVAMTRAKEALVVVGRAGALTVTSDPSWVSFLRFCLRNGLCTGRMDGEFGKGIGRENSQESDMGRLEKALRYAERIQHATDGRHGRDESPNYPSSDVVYGGNSTLQNQEVSKFRLFGTMHDLDEQMWEMHINREGELAIREEEDAGDCLANDDHVDDGEEQEGWPNDNER